MRADGYLQALDLGTSGLKVAVTTLRGELVGAAVERYPLHLLEGGGVDPGLVAGVACCSQWSGTLPVGSDGRPLMRPIIWMDSRGAEPVRRVTRGFPPLQGYGAAKLAA